MNSDEARQAIATVPYWFHRIEVADGVVTPGEDDSPAKARTFQLPEDLTGVRVLDIGAYDGYFSFECERRGADVVAYDVQMSNGFRVASELLGSTVEFRQGTVYEISPERLGTFDLVLFLGVLYHLRHPLAGLEAVRSVCVDRMILESQICDHWFLDETNTPRNLAELAPSLGTASIAEFYPGNELNGDPSNWWSPTVKALHGMVQTSGFEIERSLLTGSRACLHVTVADVPQYFGENLATLLRADRP